MSSRSPSNTSTHHSNTAFNQDTTTQSDKPKMASAEGSQPDTAPAPAGPQGAGAGAGGPGGPPGGKPQLKKFSYGFWSPELAMLRSIIFKILGGGTVITILVMWICLPFYWGSLWKSNRYTNKLTVRVINRDSGSIGSFVSSALLNQTNLKYFYTSVTEFPTDAEVENDIVEEGAWAAIVVQPGVTANLLTARQTGNSSWNGTSAVHVYYNQGRQETAVNSYLVPYIQAELGAIVGRASAQSIGQYISSNSGNTTAMNLLAQAPTTVTNSVYFTMVNLRPYSQPVAQAITLVGLIYMLIFSFIITMNNNAAREIIGPYLRTKDLIIMRLAVPMILYLPISFLFAMISLPFKVDFGAHYTYAGGFFLWAFTLYLGMSAVGLATEFAITILGPKFMGFFLIPLIIANVSVASLPHELQPWIYRYGVAMPFYNVGRVVRTIIFNTKNTIALNIGILLAWTVFSLITITFATWLFRRFAINAHRKEMGENEFDEKA
ncbi:hypothetical protein JCM24511_05397 [Saitozyma sp. JCM 24511]|nr:hypothetical protein JCM24511_05397 [Saitozyma sp. JCM 24511]